MVIITILILGFILRLVNLNQSLWLDETVQALTSKGTFLNLFSELHGDFHPPLYHLLIWGWAHLLGNGEIAMRLPSVIFGTATIFIVYLIAKQIVPKKFSIPTIAALFLATAPFHIYYSQEARTYALTTFLASLSFYFFLKIINHSKQGVVTHDRTANVLYVLTTVLMLYSDYYGLFVFLAQIMTTVLIFRQKFSKFLNLYILIILLFLPCLPLLWLQLKTGGQATTVLPEWGRLVNLDFLKALPLTFIKFSIGRITIFNKTFYALAMVILFLVYGTIIFRGFLKSKKSINHKSLFIILAWLFIPILSAWLISFFVPNYQPFRLLLVLPAFYLLLAYGVLGFSTMILRRIIVGLILVVNLVAVGVYYFNPYFHREDWRGAVNFIEEGSGEGTIALLPSYTSHFPYTYYSKGKVKLIGIGQDIRPINEDDLKRLSRDLPFSIVNSPFSIYYVYYLADLFDPQNLIPNWLESQKFVKIREVSFNQIRIQEWQRWKQKDDQLK